ncbi:MAG: MFS transporter [Pedosphaera sp.]|nr:MFS transporter [Pedosphaera sp.]
MNSLLAPLFLPGLSPFTLCFHGLVGFFVTDYIDRYERRQLLLLSYAGFIIGTLACALSHSLLSLAVSRSICGAFGGICGSMVMTTASDIVPTQRRAAGLSLVTISFSISLAGGVPLGLYLANRFNWEAPFWFIGLLSIVNFELILQFLPSRRAHISPTRQGGFAQVLKVLKDPNARRALTFSGSLVFTHFTIIPMLAPYLIANTGFSKTSLFAFYCIGGILSLITTPIIGLLADQFGRFRVYIVLVAVATFITFGLTHAEQLPLWTVIPLGAAFFVFGSGRFIPVQAICSLAIQPSQRGAFMSLNSCSRDLMAGITSTFGGWMITTSPQGTLSGYNFLGWLAIAAALISLLIGARVLNVEPHSQLPH